MFSKKVTKQSAETLGEVVEQRSCVHFDKCVDLEKLLKKMKACEQIKCRECKERSEGRVSRYSFSAAKKAIWLCLECGCYICGGVDLPTDAQSHVRRHIKMTCHRLVIQCDNTRLRWCFACQSLLTFEKEENGEKIDLLLEAVKLIKERFSRSETEAEDSCSRSGTSISGEIKVLEACSRSGESKDSAVVSRDGHAETGDSCSRSGSSIFGEIKGLEARDGYAVRGLVNLGNTCFFNSVLQNLLSLDHLRDHLLKEDPCCGGPLVSSLKKLFTEATSEPGLFNSVMNPGDVFVSLCSKAPQFKGYRQHDSHELLRCLLDGLSIEESSLRKKLDDSDESKKPTVVDSVFGGEVSSTISCLECGHSSKVYEPFLDLSLPVPSKKPPPRKQQTLFKEQRSKLPPTKVLENVADSKDSEPVSTMSLDNKQVPEIATQNDTEEVDSFWWDTFGVDVFHNETDVISQCDVSDTPLFTQSEVADQTFVGSTETVPDKEDAKAMQCSKETASSNIPGLGQSSSSTNLWDDEGLPLVVADSQVLYMPYKDDTSYEVKPVAEGKGEASSSDVNGYHEQNVDYVDFSWFFDETEVSCNDKKVRECEGEASYSFVRSHHGQAVDYVDLNEPNIPSSDKTVRECEGEVSSSLLTSQHGQTVDYVDLKDPEVSCNDKTVKEREGEVSSSLVSSHHGQTIDHANLTEPDVSCKDKTVKECEGEASSSFVSGHQEQKIENADYYWFFEEPETPKGPIFGPLTKAEVSKSCFTVSSNSDAEVLDDSDSPVSVDRCLSLFTKPEVLSGDNAWHCENCSNNLKLQRLREKRETKERLANEWMSENGAFLAFDECRDNLLNQYFIDLENWETMYDEAVELEEVVVRSAAIKRVLVNKAPPVLTIHLKRFSQDARGRLSKLRGHVEFSEFIDLGLFMDMDSSSWTVEDQPVYMLAGLVEHSGTMRRGHYVAYIRGDHNEKRDSSIWYRASDSFVRQVPFEEVLRSEAYILFYQRI